MLQYTEHKDRYLFLGKDTSIFQVLELFEDYGNRGKRLDAVLITEHGKASEKLIGIMTVSDLPRALSEVA